MGSEWRSVRLVDITSKLGDGLHGTPKYSPAGEYYFINGNNLLNGAIAFDEKTKRVDHSEFLKYQKELNSRTMLVSINGTIGNIAFYNGEKVVLGKSACYFNIIDSVDKEFIRYILADHGFQSYIEAFATGTTIKNVSLKTMREFEFKLPEIQEQKRIAHILSCLDSKITLNRQLNQTLEQMAQALFKSWFVDFDPVIDNALAAGNLIPDDLQDRAERRQLQLAKADHKPLPENIRKLFPSEFELTESLGWVPKGWAEGELQNFGKVVTGKTPPSSIENAYSLSGSPFITPTDISEFAYVIGTGRYLSVDGIKAVAKNKIDAGSICVSCIGSQMGKTVLTPIDAYTNQQINSVVLSNKEHRAYLFLNLRNRRDEIFALGSSGSTMPILNKSSFERLPILRPSDDVLNEFSLRSSDWLLSILKRSAENLQLANLRDTLLPKLISGELRIPEAQGLVEEVLG